MQIDWSPLRRELSHWRTEGLALPFWWRDDDAVAATPALDQLAGLSGEIELPVHLAVIPAHAQTSLVDMVVAHKNLIPTVHGWSHQNHAPAGIKKSEFGHQRDGAAQELDHALHMMRSLFDSHTVPAFIAPWNRLHSSYLQGLADAGYQIVSTFLARQTKHPVPGLLAVNTHVDPIDWRGTRGLADPDEIVEQAAAQLRLRRTGHADQSEPFGYLTHHLVHTPEIWAFSKAFVSEMLSGGAVSQTLSETIEETT